MSALPIGGDTPRRGVPAENEAVPGGGAWGVREETEPECVSVRGTVDKLMGFGLRVFEGKWTSSWASGFGFELRGSGREGREREKEQAVCVCEEGAS